MVDRWDEGRLALCFYHGTGTMRSDLEMFPRGNPIGDPGGAGEWIYGPRKRAMAKGRRPPIARRALLALGGSSTLDRNNDSEALAEPLDNGNEHRWRVTRSSSRRLPESSR